MYWGWSQGKIAEAKATPPSSNPGGHPAPIFADGICWRRRVARRPQPITHNIRSQSHTLIQPRGSSSAHIAGMPPRARFGAPPPRAHIRHHIRTPVKDIAATIICQLSSNNNRQQSWPTQSNNAGTCYLNSFRQHVPTETNHTDMPT